MIKFKRFYVSLLFTGLLLVYMPMTQADMQTYSANSAYTPVGGPPQQASYGEKVGYKAANGFANLTTGVLEIPKNIINTMNQSNFFYGVAGGFIKGTVNTLGRMGCGIIDLITLPLPTKPIANPPFIWDNFDVDTTYGDVLRVDKTQKPTPPVTPTPVVPPPAVATPPKAAVINEAYPPHQETSKKLDTLFRQEMQK